MKMIFLALIAQCSVYFALGQAFLITRASNGRDAFKIQSGSDCKSFYAVDGAHDFSCRCPARNATFAFQDRRWSCVENRKLRRHLNRGCDLTTSFTGENPDRRLPTLAFGARREISLWFLLWEFWTCTLDIRSSWYLGCKGSKIFLRRYYNAAARLFTLSRRNLDAPYVLRVNNNIPGGNRFRGKIINLVIDCRVTQTTKRVQFDSNCLLFKLKGNTTCPAPNTSVTSSSTIHQMKTSSAVVPPTSRATASHMFTHTSIIQQSVPSAIMSVTLSQTLAIKPTISDLALNPSSSHSIFSTVSTYLGSQPNITEISPMTWATKSSTTEISPTNSASQPTIPEGSSNWATTKISPTASTSESANSPTVLITQSVTSTTQLTVSEISPITSASQPVTQLIITKVSPTTTEVSLGAANTQATISEVSPVVPNTQQLRSKISPTTSDALSTASKVSPTEPDTTSTDSGTSVTPSKDPGILRKPRILLPKTLRNNQTALASNVPPTFSQDRERSRETKSPSVGLIAVIPLTLIIIAAIVISLVYQRYSSKKLRSRSDTISQMTMDTLVMSPQIGRANPPDHDRASCNTLESKYPYSLNASPFEIPEYNAPPSQINLSLEDEDTPCRWYAPADIAQRHPGKTQAPFDSALEKPDRNKKTPTDHVQENNGREENNNTNENEDPMYYVLEEPYPEDDGNGQSSAYQYDRPEEPIYCTVREMFRGSSPKPNSEASNSSNYDSKCEDEPIYNVLGRRYFQGSKVPTHYLQTSPNGPIFASMKRPSSASNNQDNVPEDADEPVYDVLDRRYFGGSKVPAHYIQIASNGPIFSSSDVPHSDPSKNGNDGPKCADEPVEKILEERYLDGSQVPVHYVRVSPNGLVFSTLEKVYRNSRKVPSYDPKCDSEPEGGNIVEERYLEGSEVPEHYVQISPNRVAFGTLEFRNARKGSNQDRKCGNEEVNSRDRPFFNILETFYRISGKGSKCSEEEPNDSIVEERYLEGSEVPKHYVKITPNGQVFSTLEKVHRNSSKESKSDSKSGNESEASIVEERYLAGSELHENYVEITQNGPVFNILEKLYRDSVKASKHDPECGREGVEGGGSIVEERYLEGSELPSHYVQITPKDPVFNILEKLYRNSRRGSNYDPERGQRGGIVEERYLEGSEVPKHYVQINSNGPGFRRYEKLHCSPRKVSDPQSGNESKDKIVEERYLEGSEVPEHYELINPNGPVFNILEKLYRDSVKEFKHDPEGANEPVDKTLEERYLAGSEVPKHYVSVTPKGLVFCTLERSQRNSLKDSNCDPKCDAKSSNESDSNIVEESYLAGSELPSHYEPISPKDPVSNILEKLYRDSVRGSKYEPERGTEPGDTIVEERYLEGSEVPKHYVQITPKGLVFSTLERLQRNSRQGSKCDPESENESEDSIVEGRYLEGSEVPKHYVQITPKGLVFSTLERLQRISREESKCDPKSENESEDSIVEGRYLEGSEVPKNYVEIAPNGPVFNILEKLYRDSVRGTKHDLEHGSESESNIVEERYLAGSQVPKHYVQITPNGLVFSTLQRSCQNTQEGSKCDPPRESEPESSSIEERHLAGSEVPKVTSKDPVLNILQRLYRNSRRKGIKRDPKYRKQADGDTVEEGSKAETTC